MDTDESFNYSFNSQSLPCPSSCPSTAGSFSSASSLSDALTPPSRNSTPQHPMEFDASFDASFGSGAMLFDFTPSPPSTYDCFPREVKSTAAPDLCHGMPMTPARSSTQFEPAMNLHGAGTMDFTPTPTQGMDPYNFMNVASASPFVLSTPSPAFNGNLPYSDMAFMWAQHTGGTPIDFLDRNSSPAVAMTTPTPSGSHRNIRRRIAVDGPQQKSVMLQQSIPKAGPGRQRMAKAKPAVGKLGPAFQESAKVAKANQHRCLFPSCEGKAYSRSEHLKRHINTKHKDNPELWTCEFCLDLNQPMKIFNRSDNYGDHVHRHSQKSAGSRTKYHPDAAARYEELKRNGRKRGSKAPMTTMKGELKTGDDLSSLSPQPSVKLEACH
ncbi:Transcription factor steA [Cytospora mali]|uniref:Transcription factor steA n=1 Tax=Cytospora mali TaxID=578113 RepID=A0A194UU91_CYTMA|nr:Transcription factor steA [Valsa mali var. pyri (nom. inval.)]